MPPKPDPKDFRFRDRKGEKLSKAPGELNGYDFLIDNCEDCEIVLADHVSQIFVDDCKRCTIFIGPVHASAFLRNCQDCKFHVICGQLRTRDCTDCDMLVLLPGQPIIETSKNLRFGPLLKVYPEFELHMEKAGLAKRFKSGEICKWTNVYDFSPNNPPGGGHWSCLNRTEVNALTVIFLHHEMCSHIEFATDAFLDASDEEAKTSTVGALVSPLEVIATGSDKPVGDAPPVVTGVPLGIAPAVVAVPACNSASEKTESCNFKFERASRPNPHEEARAIIVQASWNSLQDGVTRFEELLRESAERKGASDSVDSRDEVVERHELVLSLLRACIFQLDPHSKFDGLFDEARKRLQGSSDKPACAVLWVVSSGKAIPRAIQVAAALETSGDFRILRTQTMLHKRVAQIQIAVQVNA